MTVKDARAIARAWVEDYVKNESSVVGAFIAGSTNWKKDDEEHPTLSDVDVHLVWDAKEPPVRTKEYCDGVVAGGNE